MNLCLLWGLDTDTLEPNFILLYRWLVVAGTGDLPITGADLDISGITVRGAAVLDSVRLGPDVAVVTEMSPGAGLAMGVLGGLHAPSFTNRCHGPVRLPGVHPVPAYHLFNRREPLDY